ncbi:hypothetical protein Pfo_003587, partial [Paulownia fortunei]
VKGLICPPLAHVIFKTLVRVERVDTDMIEVSRTGARSGGEFRLPSLPRISGERRSASWDLGQTVDTSGDGSLKRPRDFPLTSAPRHGERKGLFGYGLN